MSLPIVRQAARAEFHNAADWYEQRRTGRGAAFPAAVQRVLDQIAAPPDFYPQVYQDVRKTLVSGYPYCVYYARNLARWWFCPYSTRREIRPSGRTGPA